MLALFIAQKRHFGRFCLHISVFFRTFAPDFVLIPSYHPRIKHVRYTEDIRTIYVGLSCFQPTVQQASTIYGRSKSLQPWQQSNPASPLTPFRANSNAMTASFSAPATAAPTLMRSTIRSVVLPRKSKPKPAPRSAWLSSKPLPSSTIPPSAPIGSAVTLPTASTTAPLPLLVTTPPSAASSSPPSILNSSHRRHRYASFMHRPYMGDQYHTSVCSVRESSGSLFSFFFSAG